MFGVARQNLEFKTYKKRNWIQEQSVVSSLIIQKNQKGIDSIVLITVQEELKLEMLGLLRMVKLVGVKNHVKWKLKKLG